MKAKLGLAAVMAAGFGLAGCELMNEEADIEQGDTIVITNVVVMPQEQEVAGPINVTVGNGSPVTIGDGNTTEVRLQDDHSRPQTNAPAE